MNKILILVLISVFIYSCKSSKNPDLRLKPNKDYQFESGLTLKLIQRNNDGISIDTSDKVKVHYIGKLEDGTVFDNSVERGAPISFEIGKGNVIKAWDEGLTYLKEGDSAVFICPPEIAYGDIARGKIPANSTLIFNIKIVEVKKAPKPFNTDGKDTVKLESGLKYIIVSKGNGNGAENRDKVKVDYTGYFLDGRKFDSSFDRPGNFEFIIGRNQVIKGWDLGIVGMKKGEKRQLIVPYQLAYGEQGSPPSIPPKADLIFDVEMLEIIPTKKPEHFDIEGKDTITTNSGLKYVKALATDSRKVKVGDTLLIDYTGYFEDMSIFDSSIERGEALEVQAGMKKVIPGFDEALLNMNEGEKVRFIIPYNLAYGERGMPPIIPEKANLIFDVHLIKIK
jgi:peptidylprolyl isomerase